jgi:hypothetical protein
MSKLGLGPVGVALNVSGTYLAEAAEAERLGYSDTWSALGRSNRIWPGGPVRCWPRCTACRSARETADRSAR